MGKYADGIGTGVCFLRTIFIDTGIEQYAGK